MSKERRANLDESVQALVPNEELRVSERPVEDLSSTIDGVYNKSGMFWNPEVFRNLSAVSQDIHDTRRNSRNMDFNVELNRTRNELKESAYMMEQSAKMAENKMLADMKLKLGAEITTVEEESMRNNESTTQNIQQLQGKYEKVFAKLDSVSPYMSSSFREYASSEFDKAQQRGIKTDYQLVDNRVKETFNTVFDIGVTDIYLGRKTLDQALESAPKDLFPLLNYVTDVQDEQIINEGYNKLWLSDIQKVERLLKRGEYSPEEASSIVKSSIAKYKVYEMTGKDDEGNDKSVICRLLPETINAAARLVASFDDTASKARAVYAEDSYNKLTDKDITDKNEWLDSQYFLATDMARGQQDWLKYRQELMSAVGGGSESAIKQLYEIDNRWYTQVRPFLLIKELLVKSKMDTGNFDQALRELADKKTMLDKRIMQKNFPDLVSELAWTDKSGSVYMYLGYPESDLEEIGSSLMRAGEPVFGSKEVYYKSISKAMGDFLEFAHTHPEALASISSDYAIAQNDVLNTMSPQSLIREDKETGSIAVNWSGVNEAANKRRVADQQGRIAGGSTIMGTSSPKELKFFTDSSQNMNPETRSVYYRAVANTMLKNGNRDIFTTSGTQAKTAEEKATANDIAMWGYLDSDPVLRDVGNIVLKNKKGGPNANPTMDTLKSLSGDSAINEEIQKIFTDRHIPEQYQPALRHTIVNMLVAPSVEGKEVKFDKNVINRLLDSNFTKRGTFRYMNTFKGLTAENLDNMVMETETIARNGLKGMGLAGKVTAFPDPATGTVQLKTDNKIFMGIGSGGPLAGSGLVPFSIDVKNKPANMPMVKYENAQKSMLTTATLLAGLTRIDGSPRMQSWAGKVSPDMKVTDLKKWGVRALYTLNRRDVQREWLDYYNSNFSDREVQSAPLAIKRYMVDSITRSFGNSNELMTRDQMNHMADFLYTRMQTGDTVRVDVPSRAFLESNGFPAWNIDTQVRNTGWRVTFSTTGKHAPNSLHYAGKAADIGLDGGFAGAIDSRTGKLKVSKIDTLINGFVTPNVKSKNITRILTSYPDMVKGKGSDPAYAKYRNMKNANGQPLFQYAPDHWDHFHVEFAKQMYDTRTGKPYVKTKQSFISEASPIIMKNINDGGHFGSISIQEAEMAANLGAAYNPTEFDTVLTGRSVKELTTTPILRATAWAVKYNRAKDALGSSEMAKAGMTGAKFRLQYMGENANMLKSVDKSYTIDDVIRISSKGIGSGSRGQYRWVRDIRK